MYLPPTRYMHDAMIPSFLFTRINRPLFYSKIKTKKNEDLMFINIQFFLFCKKTTNSWVGL